VTRHAVLALLLFTPGALLAGCGQGPRAKGPTITTVEAPAPARSSVAAPVRVAPVHATPVHATHASTTARDASAPALAHDDEGASLRRTLQTAPDPAARRAALDQWTRADRDHQPVIDALFTDPDPLVRRWAALALERRAGGADADRVGPAVAQALRAERDPAVRSILSRVERRVAR
jgi:hypothetical protein